MQHQANTALDARPGWIPDLRSDPSLRLLLGFAAFVLAVVLLAGFYVVIQQGVASAHTHWAKASRVVAGCESRGGSGHDCLLPAATVTVRQASNAVR